ncbi:hypothetical protein JXA85_05495 [Candidatus Woesearchaeota archaeon]|nr:hypothetical protein [Candidatus Woesearchaeota archaeon]
MEKVSKEFAKKVEALLAEAQHLIDVETRIVDESARLWRLKKIRETLASNDDEKKKLAELETKVNEFMSLVGNVKLTELEEKEVDELKKKFEESKKDLLQIKGLAKGKRVLIEKKIVVIVNNLHQTAARMGEVSGTNMKTSIRKIDAAEKKKILKQVDLALKGSKLRKDSTDLIEDFHKKNSKDSDEKLNTLIFNYFEQFEVPRAIRVIPEPKQTSEMKNDSKLRVRQIIDIYKFVFDAAVKYRKRKGSNKKRLEESKLFALEEQLHHKHNERAEELLRFTKKLMETLSDVNRRMFDLIREETVIEKETADDIRKVWKTLGTKMNIQGHDAALNRLNKMMDSSEKKRIIHAIYTVLTKIHNKVKSLSDSIDTEKNDIKDSLGEVKNINEGLKGEREILTHATTLKKKADAILKNFLEKQISTIEEIEVSIREIETELSVIHI